MMKNSSVQRQRSLEASPSPLSSRLPRGVVGEPVTSFRTKTGVAEGAGGCRRKGVPAALNNRLLPRQKSSPLGQPSPFCHPERTRISYFTTLTGATYVGLLKENHMELFEAATLDRKSGEAEGSAVRHSGAPHLPFYNHTPLRHPERSASQI